MAGVSRRGFAKMLAGAVMLPALAPLLSKRAMAADKSIKIALLLPGSVADGGWSMLAYQGLQALKKRASPLPGAKACRRRRWNRLSAVMPTTAIR